MRDPGIRRDLRMIDVKGKVLFVYDESSFCGRRGPDVLNRITGLWMSVGSK